MKSRDVSNEIHAICNWNRGGTDSGSNGEHDENVAREHGEND
jgi:hypothetical protein